MDLDVQGSGFVNSENIDVGICSPARTINSKRDSNTCFLSFGSCKSACKHHSAGRCKPAVGGQAHRTFPNNYVRFGQSEVLRVLAKDVSFLVR